MSLTGLFLITWSLSLGYMPSENQAIHTSYLVVEDVFEQQISLDVAVGWFSVYTDIDIRDVKSTVNSYTFAPYRADFTIGAEIKKGPVTIGYMHECIHAIVSPIDNYEGSVDKFYVKIQGTTRF
jgi:hypothetical protein